ncbi:MAG: ABC transporter ATP-binding protein [Actinomycetota bacterium]
MTANHTGPDTTGANDAGLAPSVMEARAVSIGYGEVEVVDGLSVEIEAGVITALCGPNGSGKSTLLKAMARLIPFQDGAVLLDGKAITEYPTMEIARRMSILPQGPRAPHGLTVRELVEQGRFPHVGALRMLRAQDRKAVDRALTLTGMLGFADRPLDALSGGERQRAWIALTLAQETKLLLLDEPTTFLDIGHQLEVLELARKLNQENGITVVIVIHDLNHAARYAERMIVLDRGSIAADGHPTHVLTDDVLERVFGVRASVLTDPQTGKPVCLPYERIEAETDG